VPAWQSGGHQFRAGQYHDDFQQSGNHRIHIAPPSAAPTSGYGFTYQDPNDPSGTTFDLRWAVIITGNGGTASSKRFILGVRQAGGNGYFQPITLDTMVAK